MDDLAVEVIVPSRRFRVRHLPQAKQSTGDVSGASSSKSGDFAVSKRDDGAQHAAAGAKTNEGQLLRVEFVKKIGVRHVVPDSGRRVESHQRAHAGECNDVGACQFMHLNQVECIRHTIERVHGLERDTSTSEKHSQWKLAWKVAE
ncbi:hypothetical protein [Paraburkholderia sp. DGU8]|uniref:hypothetical protein n=1 Tax=Paraburkholderia sp. DGU8 TaxID=3161997 RepID=UPI003466ADCD